MYYVEDQKIYTEENKFAPFLQCMYVLLTVSILCIDVQVYSNLEGYCYDLKESSGMKNADENLLSTNISVCPQHYE